METLPDASVEYLSNNLTYPDVKCDDFDRLFSLDKLIGRGGGSYVFRAITNYDDDVKYLKKGQNVVVKVCDPILTEIGCNEMIKEANNLRIISLLNARGICYNFPVFYSFGKCCLFFNKNRVIEGPESCNLQEKNWLGESIIPDILYFFSNNMISSDYIEILKLNYTSDCLFEIRKNLKLKNFHILADMWPLNHDSFTSSKIHEFLSDIVDVNCPNYIIMSYIPGEDLSKISKTTPVIDAALFFEMMYANACLIKYQNLILADQHDDNIMIGKVNMPRIYQLGDKYIYFNTSTMLFYIDAQVTKTFPYTKNSINITRLFTTSPANATKDVQEIITWLRDNPLSLDNFILNYLPTILSSNVISREMANDILLHNPNIRVANYM